MLYTFSYWSKMEAAQHGRQCRWESWQGRPIQNLPDIPCQSSSKTDLLSDSCNKKPCGSPGCCRVAALDLFQIKQVSCDRNRWIPSGNQAWQWNILYKWLVKWKIIYSLYSGFSIACLITKIYQRLNFIPERKPTSSKLMSLFGWLLRRCCTYKWFLPRKNHVGILLARAKYSRDYICLTQHWVNPKSQIEKSTPTWSFSSSTHIKISTHISPS